MFGVGEAEFTIILIFCFLVFGPEKLPEAGRVVGKAIRQFRQAQDEINDVVQSEFVNPIQEVSNISTTKISEIKEDVVALDEDIKSSAKSFAERKKEVEGRSANSQESSLKNQGEEKSSKSKKSSEKYSAYDMYGIDINSGKGGED